MFEDRYMPLLQQDPKLLDIYERAIKPYENSFDANPLLVAFTDADCFYLMAALSEGKLGKFLNHPVWKAMEVPAVSFFIDLLKPLWKAVYFKADPQLKTADDYSRYRARLWDGWMMDIIDEVLDLKRRKETGGDEFVTMIYDGGLCIRDYFMGRSVEAAQNSLLVETLRRETLKKVAGDPAKIQKLADREKSWAAPLYTSVPQLPFYLAIEVICWLDSYLSDETKDDDLANKAYYLIDEALRRMRAYDKHCGREANGVYHVFRNRVLGDLLKRHRRVIAWRLTNKTVARLNWGGLDGDDIQQEVDRAAVEAVDGFDHEKTKRPFAAFQAMVQWKVYTRLRSMRPKRETVPFEDAMRAVSEATDRYDNEPQSLGRDPIDKFDEPLPEELVALLQKWLTKTEAEVLVAKSQKEDDADLARRLGISESRVRGLSAQAQNKIRRKLPLPDLLLAAMGL